MKPVGVHWRPVPLLCARGLGGCIATEKENVDEAP
jgi:hypothetical protein